ncbi:lysine transporter LysE [Vibrio sp. 10N.286.49.C2]|uniref:LysE family translocator n=1 Tax=unclassified Vibrio TaxID=2614977 RepID=UPI000C82656F|nr:MULTISPECIES: LysE family translocator [unclassified Vibrio]PMH34806.1 lysine transporter LysE [Vibrio sp. 10N.286.49.C2]PMH51406.1 lysine transporter LysE [Vibrio sp. 10N.286.49.B1]PMH81813.1 lysine transporter LysE [Vibrio sp. 10N.286.48.B7]
MEYFLTVVLFAFSASVTPGPNNIMVMTSGVNFGVKKSLPLLIGICVGFAVMLLLVGLGFAQLFELFPSLHLIIKCIGTFYLLYLAWLIANSSGSVRTSSQARPFSFIKGALFQWVNAKAWVVATGAIAAFTTSGSNFYSQNLTIALTFFVVSFPCVGVWLLFGSMVKKWLNSDRNRAWFNYVMAGLLVVSVIPVVIDIIGQLSPNG